MTNAVVGTSELGGKRERTPLAFWLGLAAIFLLAIAAPCGWLYWEIKGYRNERAEREAVSLEMQLGRLTSGNGHAVRLENTERTADLLARIAGMPQIEALTLAGTDVTDGDLGSLALLPNLRELSIEGGRPGITNRGLERLGSLDKLERLSLVDTAIDDQGLSALRNLPNLKSLTLGRSAKTSRAASPLTDAGLDQLKPLERLRHLELAGDWASQAAMDSLREALPQCAIEKTQTSPTRD